MKNRITEMDGLRGLAVVLVMSLHIFRRATEFTQHPTLYFISDLAIIGWIGVDIFFVLSGFLITTILLKAREKEHYFRNFYIRRILRIIPLYYATLLIVFFIIIPIKTPEFSDKIPQLLPYQIFYLQNWLEFKSQTTPYIQITWSLAIEEQFYLFWPLLVYYLKRENLFKIGAGYVIISAISRAVGILVWEDKSQAANFFFYNSFPRFDELIFGGLLAMALSYEFWREKIKRISLAILYVSSAVFLILSLMDLPNLPHPDYKHIPLNIGGYTSLTLLTSALISIFIIYPENFLINRIFRNKVLTFLGKYSYAMYLFHLPIALILLDILWRTHLRGWKMYMLYVVLSFAVTILTSFASWHLFEKHFLNLKRYFEYK